MKHFIGILALLTGLLLLVSCAVGLDGKEECGPVDVSFHLVEDGVMETKGLVSMSAGDCEIRHWTVAAYDMGGRLYAQSSGDAGNCARLCLPSGRTFDIYFLVNCPGAVFPDRVDRIGDLAVTFTSVEEMARSGLPSCASLIGYVPRTASVAVRLRRLVCCLKIRVRQDGLDSMKLRRMSFYNAPSGVYPFGSRSYDGSLESFDYTTDQMERLQFGDELTLYCLENLRGTISNDDPKGKVPENMTDQQRRYATYVDVEADVEGRVEGTVHYRIYPGANTTSDFNLRRSSVYSLDLSLSKSELLQGCLVPYWKIDVSGVEAVRLMGCHWESHGGYFWPSRDWRSDRLVVDNPFGRIQYTILTAEDSAMSVGVRRFGPYEPGGAVVLDSGESSFLFGFADSYVDVNQHSADSRRWWSIRVVDVDDGSTVVAPIYQDGQSPLSLEFQPGRILSDLYVGQTCSVVAEGQIEDWSRLEWEVVGEKGVVSLDSYGSSKSNRISCLGPGTVTVMARCGDIVSETYTIHVSRPNLRIPGTLHLYEDGKDVRMSPKYCRTNGIALQRSEFDDELFGKFLGTLSFSWRSGRQPDSVDVVRAEDLNGSGSAFSDWVFHLTDVMEPGPVDRVTVRNQSGDSCWCDVTCLTPFPTDIPDALGTVENYYYLQGDRRTGPLTVPYMIPLISAGDIENVSVTDGSGLFSYGLLRYGDGYRLGTVDISDSAFRTSPDCCGDVNVHMSVRNRYSGRTYQSPAVYTFSVRLHLAVVMKVYSEPWPSGWRNFWYLTPCWYVPDGCSADPYRQISPLVVSWHRYNSETHDTSYNCLELKHFDACQIGDYAENLYRKHGISSPTAYEEGQILLSDWNDFDLSIWWEKDPSNRYYTNTLKSFKGGTLPLIDCPEVGKDILLHDFTYSLDY